jgi:hypothetical protein
MALRFSVRKRTSEKELCMYFLFDFENVKLTFLLRAPKKYVHTRMYMCLSSSNETRGTEKCHSADSL